MDTLIKQKVTKKTLDLAFVGLGWIGKHRMEKILDTKLASPAVIADSNPEILRQFDSSFNTIAIKDFREVLNVAGLDGIVIATPSALHAAQAEMALSKGIPVFCQKPLGRNSIETKAVVDAAARSNCLIGVDLSYRYTDAFLKILSIIRSEELGNIFAVNLVFHNAYGPDKSWFYDINLSGGGCLIDLGIHMIDLALYALDFPKIKNASGKFYFKGEPLKLPVSQVEDYASAQLELENGAVINLNCSWDLPAGCDAVIEASFYGTKGGVSLKNVNGSFYDFNADLYKGTKSFSLSSPPDEWGGRAAVDWVKRLSRDTSFNPSAYEYVKTAHVLDLIYGRNHE